MNGSSTSDSAPSEARKRGSGGGSPRKHDDLLTGPSDLDAQSSGKGVRELVSYCSVQARQARTARSKSVYRLKGFKCVEWLITEESSIATTRHDGCLQSVMKIISVYMYMAASALIQQHY
jgi:hypothetical protein